MINMTIGSSSVEMKISFYNECTSSLCGVFLWSSVLWLLQRFWRVITRWSLSTFCKPDCTGELFHQHLEDSYFICNNPLEDCLQVFIFTWLLMVCTTRSLLYFFLYFNAVNIFYVCILELFCFCNALLAYCL